MTLRSLSSDSIVQPRLVIGVYYLLTVVGFVVPAASVNFTSGIYSSALAAVFVCWLLLPVTLKNTRFDTLEKSMLGFWLLYCGFTFLDLSFRSEWDWKEFQEPSRFLLLLPVFLAVRKYGFNVNALRFGVLLGAILAGIWGYYQKMELGMQRAMGDTRYQIAAFGDIGLISGVMTVALLQPLWKTSKLWLLITFVGFGAGVFASLASGTKGGWISVPFLCWILVELTDNPTYRKRFAAMGILFVTGLLVWWLSPFIQDRVSVIGPAIYKYFVLGEVHDFSAGIRLALWHGAVLIFWDNPLFGTGPGTYGDQLRIYVDSGALTPEVLKILAPHSQFFNSIVESGTFGPVMVYGIYISFILHCKRHLANNKSLATTGILMAVGFMDFGLVEVIWDINIAGVYFTVMMVLIAGLLSHQNIKSEP